jgi:hypothetical protein
VMHSWSKLTNPTVARLLLAVAPLVSAAAPAECPVTVASSSPVELRAGKDSSWYGGDALAVLLPIHGKWIGSPQLRFGGKLWLWRRGYDATSELRPDLVIDGLRLDPGKRPERLYIKEATNGMGKDWNAMLVGLEFPSAGCWQLTATYTHVEIKHELTFVLNVSMNK